MKKNYVLLLSLIMYSTLATAQNVPSINENKKNITKSNDSIKTSESTEAPTKISWFLPTRNKDSRTQFFDRMYNNNTDNTHYVNSFSLTGNDNGATVQSELVTDNINWVRVAFGSLITTGSNEDNSDSTETAGKVDEQANEAETQNEAFKRLINGGGNFYLEFVLPLISTNNGAEDQLFTSYTYSTLRGGADIKGFGNTIDTATGNASIGINSYLGASSNTKKFNFFINGCVYYTMGTDDFYQNLGINNNKGFINGKITAGVTLLNIVKISGMINSFGSEESLRSGKIVFGVQILPN